MITGAQTCGRRGAWVFLNALLLPWDPTTDALLSMGVGALGLMIAAGVQPGLASWARNHPTRHSLWLADALYSYVAAWVCVFYWRGVWALWDVVLNEHVPVGAVDVVMARHAAICHACGVLLLIVLGAVRNLVAAPMVVTSDAAQPIFGGGSTFGLGGLNPFDRYRLPPKVQDAESWHRAVGVPYLSFDHGPDKIGATGGYPTAEDGLGHLDPEHPEYAPSKENRRLP